MLGNHAALAALTLTLTLTAAPDAAHAARPVTSTMPSDTVAVDDPTEDGAAPVRVRASRSAVGGAAALERVRALKRERQARDQARDEVKRGRTAAIVRIENETTDDELPARAAAIIEAELRQRGMFVKDHRAVLPVIEKRGFKGFRSSRALRLLADHLGTNLLLFMTIERVLVSTFTDEYRELAASGSLSLPGEEFVELQIRLGAFDAARSEVLFSRRDRQFLVFGSGGDPGVRQASFDESLTTCLHNLLLGLP